MTALTRSALLRDAEQRLRQRDPHGALQQLVALVRSAPHDLDARLRAADVLLASGATQQAIAGYMFVATEGTHGGFPLKAVVALKVLANLDPAVASLFAVVAQKYAAGSPSLGRGVRVSPPSADALVPPGAFPPPDLSPEQLRESATGLLTSREGLAPWPESVAAIPLLSELSADAFGPMLAAVELRRFARGAVMVREGEPGDAFFMVARGRVRVTRLRDGEDQELAILGEGALLGEMALLTSAPRAATVTALDDVDALAFGREALTAVSRDIAVVAAGLDRFMKQRLLDHLLRTHEMFRPFDNAQRVQLASRFEHVIALAETVVIRQGDEGRGLYLVLSGAAKVTRETGNGEVDLATLGPGDVFGEMSLLDDALTNATVTTTARSTLLLLPRPVFERLVSGVGELRAWVEGIADDRRMDTNITLSLVPGEVWV